MNYKLIGVRQEMEFVGNLVRTKVEVYLDFDGRDIIAIFYKCRNENGWFTEQREQAGLWKVKDRTVGGCKVVGISSKDMKILGLDDVDTNKMFDDVWDEIIKYF